MKSASIYQLSEKSYLVHALNKAKSGFWIASDPYKHIQEELISAGFLVSEIKSSLVTEDSERVPDPKDWTLFNKEMLRKMGLKSSSVLHEKNVKYCSIRMENGMLTFTPSRHAEKLSEGFLHKNEGKVTIAYDAPDEEIFNSLGIAFSRCE